MRGSVRGCSSASTRRRSVGGGGVHVAVVASMQILQSCRRWVCCAGAGRQWCAHIDVHTHKRVPGYVFLADLYDGSSTTKQHQNAYIGSSLVDDTSREGVGAAVREGNCAATEVCTRECILGCWGPVRTAGGERSQPRDVRCLMCQAMHHPCGGRHCWLRKHGGSCKIIDFCNVHALGVA